MNGKGADQDGQGALAGWAWVRRAGTRVVLALPFLVGHRPDATSTIRGFRNTQRDETLDRTERLLAERVAAFRAALAR